MSRDKNFLKNHVNTIKICLGKKTVVAKVRDDRCIMNTKCS